MEKRSHKVDPRFKIAEKEAWIGIGLVLFNFIWWFGFAYGMGSAPVEKYEYIWGLPAWFFYSCVAGFIIMVMLVIVAVKFFFKDVSFDEETEGGTSAK
ncbi:YhdT family protein [Bacillus sp. DTU_2020_1000418_1_SI_GHA_SEK_038]|uniref:YhdT family protein n=1 Tax=Bacillus sp. DTU_2020_1000418_1_SI_GHA_SEK_038 TaxID=3077585 RepID=UPI0028E4AA47|nr:YhdT family protein [Bacillus sp. DTU_2020_1000418_1_SI_GHA_SEK_038]WNS76351.1 YhdT family protein [Bacillus sp. DTU_2020_1000418_1_SI_GHA_SEK_038]